MIHEDYNNGKLATKIANCANLKDEIFSKETINKRELKMKDFLQKTGFYKFESQYDNLLKSVKDMSKNTFKTQNNQPNPQEKSFDNQKSLIHVDEKSVHNHFDGDILAIDIGGSHTKAAFLKEGDDVQKAKFVVDKHNDDFKNVSDEKENIRAFIEAIAINIKESNIDTSRIKGVAIIWSNALIAKKIDSKDYSGISGVTTGVNEGFYQKGEWFTKDLKNGVDIGEIFHEMFLKHGIDPKTLIISNDTIFTQKALENADAGAVMSTGANSTGVTNDGEICNLESGAQVKLDNKELSLVDREVLDEGVKDYSIQYMCAGKWLHKQLKAYIIKGAKEGIEEFNDIAMAINSGRLKIENTDITKILDGEYPFLEFLEAEESVRELCKAIVDRAAKAGALILYSSVADKLDDGIKHDFKFALDSSLARNIKLFKDKLYDYFCEITNLKKENLVLLSPLKHTNEYGDDVEITVPIIGAFNSIRKY